MQNDTYYKQNPRDKIWWKETPDTVGEFIFSFDKKKDFNLFRDYPAKLTRQEKALFDKENPFWADFFSERS